MSSFTTPLRFELLGGRLFALTDPFEYHVGAYPGGTVIRVPKGFVTDLASIPRALWSVFPPDGDYAKAAVVHGVGCQTVRESRNRNYIGR